MKFVASQAVFVLIVSLACYEIWGFEYARSSFIGGMVAVIPSFIFAVYAIRFTGAKAARMVAQSFYRGQSLKLLTTFVLFIVAFNWLNVIAEPMFLTFFLTLLTHWFTPFYFNQR